MLTDRRRVDDPLILRRTLRLSRLYSRYGERDKDSQQ